MSLFCVGILYQFDFIIIFCLFIAIAFARDVVSNGFVPNNGKNDLHRWFFN